MIRDQVKNNLKHKGPKLKKKKLKERGQIEKTNKDKGSKKLILPLYNLLTY